MTAFTAMNLPCDTEDKGFEYPTQILEEPFSDLFDQYLTHTISDLGPQGLPANDVDFSDFFTDGDTTSSASYATDSTSSAPFPPSFDVAHDRSQRQTTSSLTRTAFLPQNYQNRTRREKLAPAVSGLELLLDIEGQANSRAGCSEPPHSAPATLTSLPLRRKPRFNRSKSKDLQDRDHRISKSSPHPPKEPSNMIRPLYNYRIESPQPQEWVHSSERLSLLSAFKPLIASPTNPLTPPISTHGVADAHVSRQMTLREQFFEGESDFVYGVPHTANRLHLSLDATIEGPAVGSEQSIVEQDDLFDDFREHLQDIQSESTVTHRQPFHSASWAASESSSSNAACIVPLSPTGKTWNHGLPADTTNYYSNGLASKSAPALACKPRITGDTASAYLQEDPTGESTMHSQGYQAFDIDSNEYPPPSEIRPSPLDRQEQSHTPPRRTSSPSTQPSSLRSRRRSKSAQRRKSAGNLKSSKSPAAMGFVNFTPSDSKRILTGVAPSGSSKTKARREQEANEKKRKLSLAVLRAVEEAGGDPEPLRKEGLLIDEDP